MKTAFYFLLLFFNLVVVSLSTAQQVHTYVSTDSVQVGDLFTYTIVFNGTYDNIEFPAEDVFEKEFTVNSVQRYQPSTNKDSLVYNLQFFGVDDITISRKQIAVQTADGDTTFTTTPVPLFFKSSLADGDEEFRPIKPIFEFARAWWPYILVAILLIAAAIYFYRWYSNREIPEEPEPSEPPPPFSDPLEQLKETISNLSDIESLHSFEEYESFYIVLGDAIRLYLKRVYKFHALEMTTTEIVLSLQDEHAPPKIITITRKVLNEADIVKFANFNPGQNGARSAWQTAQQFIETVEVLNREQIQFMKYKYEVKYGLRGNKPKKTEQETV